MRCARTLPATAATSALAASRRPSNAAFAAAALSIVMSALCPSTPKYTDASAAVLIASGLSATDGMAAWASTMRLRSSAWLSSYSSAKASGSLSNDRRLRTTSILTATSFSPFTSTAMPKRSSSCGLRSPSSGFMVPMSMNLDGCEKETPSRST